MLRTILILLLGLNLSTVLGQGEGGEEECGGAGSTAVWIKIDQAYQYYSRCSYPTDKLNVDCILASCPSLSGACPLTSNGSVNQTALTTAASILNTCIAQNSLVCCINMSRIPVVLATWSIAQLVPLKVASGTVSLTPETGFIYNLSTATFSLPPLPTNGSLTLLIRAPNIIHYSQCSANFTIGNDSFVNIFRPIVPITLTIPDITGILRINLSSVTISIDLSTSPYPTIETLDSQCDMHSEFTNFTSEIGAPVPRDVVQPFNDMMNKFLQDSILAATATNFLSTFAALGLRAAQLNCPTHQ